MIELIKMNHSDEKESYFQIDLKIESFNQDQNNQKMNSHINMKISNRMHISTLSSSSTH